MWSVTDFLYSLFLQKKDSEKTYSTFQKLQFNNISPNELIKVSLDYLIMIDCDDLESMPENYQRKIISMP